MTLTRDRLKIGRLHPLFAAEVTGVDLTRPVDDADFAAIEAAFEEHSVLVFRDQRLDDGRQIAFTERFGPLENMLKGSMTQVGMKIANLSNVDPDTDRIIPPDDDRMLRNRANELWHTDSSFKPVPAKASLLSGREVPPDGGETEFAGMRAAWEGLAPERQSLLETLTAEHSFHYSRMLVSPHDYLTDEQKAEVPSVPQPMVRTNPVNGRKALYIGSHASHVIGWPRGKGRALLDELTAHATRPEFVYRHRWRPFDLVMWDNRAVMHRGRPFDYPRHRRVMHRTTLAGDAPAL